MMSQYFGLESSGLQEARSNQHSNSNLRIAIQDSTGSNSSNLRPLINVLAKAGYRNVYVSKLWGEPLMVTHIVAQQGDGASAESIRNDLGFGEVRVESTGSLDSDVSIQVGKDWLEHRSMSPLVR
jgi:hypothetical protein